MKEALSTLMIAVFVLAMPLFAAEIRYAYDERRQLTSVVRDGRDAFGYGYDLAGNLRWASIGCQNDIGMMRILCEGARLNTGRMTEF